MNKMVGAHHLKEKKKLVHGDIPTKVRKTPLVRRKAAIAAARAIFKRRRRAVELQPQSVAEKSTCCPLCGKAGIRLVAFTDAPGILHIIVAGPMPCDS
jgi:hypothetical protein